jgi:hypothetical protein
LISGRALEVLLFLKRTENKTVGSFSHSYENENGPRNHPLFHCRADADDLFADIVGFDSNITFVK